MLHKVPSLPVSVRAGTTGNLIVSMSNVRTVPFAQITTSESLTLKMARRTTRSKTRLRPPALVRQSSGAHQLDPSIHDPEQAPPTCRSAFPHPKAVRDHVKHYFACIEIAERVGYLDLDPDVWKNHDVWKHELELERASLGPMEEYAQGEIDIIAQGKITEKIANLAVAIEAHYQRTADLRNSLGPDPAASSATTASQQAGHLVRCVENSRQKWAASATYQGGIELVRKWRSRRPAVPRRETIETLDSATAATDGPPETDNARGIEPERQHVRDIISEFYADYRLSNAGDGTRYALEQDVNAYLIQYSRNSQRRRTTASSHDATLEPSSHSTAMSKVPGMSTSKRVREDCLHPVDEDLKLDNRFRGRFPDQRLPMNSLLTAVAPGVGSPNVLSSKDCHRKDPSRIRYFHIPYNNMQVSTRPRGFSGHNCADPTMNPSG